MKLHNIPPVYDKNSKILILGSFPSVRSREAGFFYAHPQNRFWRLTAALFGEEVPLTVDAKRDMLIKHGAALWDVVASCEIMGSSDASITDIVPNDIPKILAEADIRAIFCNGGKSHELYRRYILPVTHIEAVKLPSTSPANAAWSLERLISAWEVIKLPDMMT